MTIQQIMAAIFAFAAVIAGSLLIARIERKSQAAAEEKLSIEKAFETPLHRLLFMFLSSRDLRKLNQAGIVSVDDQSMFSFARIGISILLGWGAGWSMGSDTAAYWTLVIMLVGAGIGWWISVIWLDLRSQARKTEIETHLPLMLDLVEICLQGGVGLDAAFDTVQKQISLICPPLASEMAMMRLELNLGVSRDVAIRRIGERTGVAGFPSLATLLGQSERFGTGLADTLKAHADSLRYDQLQAMEERVQLMSVKILFPLTVCLLPAVMLMVGGPLLAIVLRGIESL